MKPWALPIVFDKQIIRAKFIIFRVYFRFRFELAQHKH